MNKKIKLVTNGAMIAAAYVVLTLIAAALGLSSGTIQLRFSEALCILPYFTPAAIPGLTIGCFISNIITSGNIFDIAFGTAATLIGAGLTWALRKYKWMAPIPPIISNTIIIPFVLSFALHAEESIPYLMVTVGLGEILSVGVLGTILLIVLDKYKAKIFR